MRDWSLSVFFFLSSKPTWKNEAKDFEDDTASLSVVCSDFKTQILDAELFN